MKPVRSNIPLEVENTNPSLRYGIHQLPELDGTTRVRKQHISSIATAVHQLLMFHDAAGVWGMCAASSTLRLQHLECTIGVFHGHPAPQWPPSIFGQFECRPLPNRDCTWHGQLPWTAPPPLSCSEWKSPDRSLPEMASWCRRRSACRSWPLPGSHSLGSPLPRSRTSPPWARSGATASVEYTA
jgi:hypothetical protein